MSETDNKATNNQYQQRIIDLSVNGHLMSLDSGLYCIYHVPNQVPADEFGFPGLRLSVPPFKQEASVRIETFEKDGWLGAEKNAVLVRISGGPGLILVTVYRNPANNHPAPQLQVIRLNDAPDQIKAQHTSSENAASNISMTQMSELAEKIEAQSQYAASQQNEEINKEKKMSIIAHVQRMGDVSVNLGDWIGIPDSKTWIEGFGVALDDRLQPEDIEYQAVLGKGWLSPWYKGNQFCGSRGMSLPLCGLRVRLSDEAAKKYKIHLLATFIDGTKLGPVEDDTTLSAESVAPLEAICLNIIEKDKQPTGHEVAEENQTGSHKKDPLPKEKTDVSDENKADDSSDNRTKNNTSSVTRTNIKTKKVAAKDAILKVAKKKITSKRNKT